MSYSTGPLPRATTDSFNAAAAVVLNCYGARSVLVVITNAGAVIQVAEPGGRPDTDPAWGEEFYAPPGAYPLDADDNESIDAVRVRSSTPGKPANVSVVAFR